MSKKSWIISIGALALSVVLVYGSIFIERKDKKVETSDESKQAESQIEHTQTTSELESTTKEEETEQPTESESLIQPGIVIPIQGVPDEVKEFCGEDYDALEGKLMEVMLAFYFGKPKRAEYDSHKIEGEKITVCFKMIMDANEYTDIMYYRDLRKVTYKIFS